MPRCIILTPLYAGEELPWISPQPAPHKIQFVLHIVIAVF